MSNSTAISSRRLSTALLALVTALAAGCATAPPAPAPAPQIQPLAEYMAQAERARSEKATTKERDTYRLAASHYPTAKEPWVKLAESFFEAADYGNAVLAAQEVLQRDAADVMASGVIAVSGLRISTQALATLRAQSTAGLPSDTRTQAEGLTRTLRELLGESVLVPPAAEPEPEPEPAPAPRKRASKRTTRPAATQAAAPPKPAPKNPFDALK